ncbi:MAG: DUF805 domain-containing protein [Rhodobacteraceae bacterium]|nr:MAG: DUF805 domain-containing protein [Paracoccaceae bacterium]
MGFTQAIQTCLRKYFVFQGRASRSEFWWFALATTVISIVLSIIEGWAFDLDYDAFMPISDTFSILTTIPSISVGCRRLHDINKSGWWQVLPIAPLILAGILYVTGIGGLITIGIIIAVLTIILLIYWFVKKGAQGDNRFGADPLA